MNEDKQKILNMTAETILAGRATAYMKSWIVMSFPILTKVKLYTVIGPMERGENVNFPLSFNGFWMGEIISYTPAIELAKCKNLKIKKHQGLVNGFRWEITKGI